jgi:hypothetical protein
MDVNRLSRRLRLVVAIKSPQSPVHSPLPPNQPPPNQPRRRPWTAEACCRFHRSQPAGPAPIKHTTPITTLPTRPSLPRASPLSDQSLTNLRSQISNPPPPPAPQIQTRIIPEPDSTHYHQRTSSISGLTAILERDIADEIVVFDSRICRYQSRFAVIITLFAEENETSNALLVCLPRSGLFIPFN